MKKTLFCLVLVSICFSFAGCESELTTYVKDNLSEIVETYYECKGENFIGYIYCGEREEEYAMDGVSHELSEYALLKIILKSGATYESISMILYVDDTANDIKVSFFQVDGNYYAELMFDFSEDSSLRLNYANESVEFNCRSNEFEISVDKVLEIACENLKTEILNSKNSYSCEFYVRVLSSTTLDGLFYGFIMIDEKSNMHAVVIDTKTGDVVSSS